MPHRFAQGMVELISLVLGRNVVQVIKTPDR